MPVYQPHQRFRYQKEERGSKFGRILVIIVIIIVLFFIGRGLFGGKKSSENINNFNSNLVSVANIIANINGNLNTNANTNTTTNLNTNTTVGGPFSIDTCNQTYSRGVDKQQIALTFNVGTAKEGEIQKVLDTLKSQNTAASFFARGDVAEANPDLINKIDQAGFPIYNLSYNYPHFNDLPESAIREQLEKAENAISQRTNKTTKPFFRPPYNEIVDNDVFNIVKEEGYCPITGLDAMDWSAEMTADQSKERVLSKATNGAIVLMQASNSITAEILSSLITDFKAKGYSLVDLKTLLSE